MKVCSMSRRAAKRRGSFRHVTLYVFCRRPHPIGISIEDRFFFSWEYVDKASHPAYMWMNSQLSRLTRLDLDRPPVWAWKRFSSRRVEREAVGALWGGNEKYFTRIAIRVPRCFVLQSSYSAWCEMLFDSISNEICFDAHPARGLLFSTAAGRHGRYVQAVIPYLAKDWITSIKKYQL